MYIYEEGRTIDRGRKIHFVVIDITTVRSSIATLRVIYALYCAIKKKNKKEEEIVIRVNSLHWLERQRGRIRKRKENKNRFSTGQPVRSSLNAQVTPTIYGRVCCSSNR